MNSASWLQYGRPLVAQTELVCMDIAVVPAGEEGRRAVGLLHPAAGVLPACCWLRSCARGLKPARWRRPQFEQATTP